MLINNFYRSDGLCFFEYNGKPKNYTWPGQGGCDDRNNVNIFDTSFGNVFIRSENELSYDPPILIFFNSLIKVCEKITTNFEAIMSLQCQPQKPLIPVSKKET